MKGGNIGSLGLVRVGIYLKGIQTRLLSGQTGNHSIPVGLNCVQVKTGD